MADRFELMEHTGDLGLKVWSSSLEGIFATSAQGLFSIITDLEKITPQARINVKLMAENDAELLVRWLNHLNFLFSTEGMLFCEFEIAGFKNHAIQAHIFGEELQPEKHEILREIKAVTYHQLQLNQNEEGWFAQVILDL